MDLERRSQRLLPLGRFLARLACYVALSAGVVLLALAVGMAGYHRLEGLSWLDSFLNAAMILGSMGPVDPLHTEAGKLFAGIYALFSGLVFVVAAGLLLTPLAHRLLHHFHLEKPDDERR